MKEISYLEHNKHTTKELCEYFDKEDCLPVGTHYRRYIAQIMISLTLVGIMVGLFLFSIIK